MSLKTTVTWLLNKLNDFLEKIGESDGQREEEVKRELERRLRRKRFWARLREIMKNNKRLVIMWVAIGIIVLMCLFPPWIYHRAAYNQLFEIKGPYHLIFSPPYRRDEAYLLVKLDWPRLLIPIGIVAILAVGLIVTIKDRKLT